MLEGTLGKGSPRVSKAGAVVGEVTAPRSVQERFVNGPVRVAAAPGLPSLGTVRGAGMGSPDIAGHGGEVPAPQRQSCLQHRVLQSQQLPVLLPPHVL